MLEKLDKKKSENDYAIIISIKFGAKEGALTPHPSQNKKKNQNWFLCQNSLTRELKIRVVGFVLQKLFTYFEMLIVPHALQCVDGCFFVFYRI